MVLFVFRDRAGDRRCDKLNSLFAKLWRSLESRSYDVDGFSIGTEWLQVSRDGRRCSPDPRWLISLVSIYYVDGGRLMHDDG